MRDSSGNGGIFPIRAHSHDRSLETQTATFLRRLSRHAASWRNGRQVADQMVGLGALSFAQSD
jgi:hypothetical protein